MKGQTDTGRGHTEMWGIKIQFDKRSNLWRYTPQWGDYNSQHFIVSARTTIQEELEV